MFSWRIGLIVAAALVAVGVVAKAQSGGVLHACVAPNGVMRLVDSETACKKNEQVVSWNIQGPKGDSGEPGGKTLPDGRCWANRFRYVDCANGTVTDQLTGLIWLKDSTCLTGTTYADANIAAQSLKEGDCGLTDGSVAGQWRLPTLAEWQATTAIAGSRGCQPALTDNSGTLCYSDVSDGVGVNERALFGVSIPANYFFWSSTIYEVSSAAAWGAVLTGGGAAVGGLNDPFNVLPVWPVRSGEQ